MLFKTDTLFGHVIDETEPGVVVYRDDGTPVDFANPRTCKGCHAKCQTGGHDPCIANLPGTYQACCGHGLDKTPGDSPSGYVGLTDGRIIEFSGLMGGKRIREAVDAALAGEALPEGFQFGERMWWEGLTEAQRAYVHGRIPDGLAILVRESLDGAEPNEAFLKGEAMWYEGLTGDQKSYVWSRLPAQIAAFAQEALVKA